MRPEEILKMYRARDCMFGGLDEPKWRMVLDLYQNGECSVTSAAIASGRACTTALRHIDRLECSGVIQSRDDNIDGRMRYLSLSAYGREMLGEFFAKYGGA